MTVLTIAGSDPGGGAGIQADLKTFAALHCYGMSAITAITVQNTLGVRRVFPLPGDLIEEQIGALLEDIGADAVKIGMLFDAQAVHSVERALRKFEGPIVIDPVITAKGGKNLMQKDAQEALKALVSRALLITPNTDEIHLAARAKNVLFKGGHLRKPDYLQMETGERHEFASTWIDTPNTHGTGCTYASAITAYLAHGFSLLDAVRKAKAYLHGAIASGAVYRLGKGRGPVDHFWNLR